MAESIDWRALRAKGQAHAEKQVAAAAKGGSVAKDFYGAGLIAIRAAAQDGLQPEIDEYGETRYTAQQGRKAACHAREDVTAILIIQQAVLRRLQGLRIIAWCCLAALIYIALRVS